MSVPEFYGYLTKWQSGDNMITHQNCFAVNFGYNGEIPFPTISIPINAQKQLDQFLNFEKDYKCYYIFVGGTYAQDMKTVMDIVEGITAQFHGMGPKAMFLLGKYSTADINKISLFINNLTMVRELFKKNWV